LCYYEAPPGIQILHCLNFKTTGGESFFADGFKISEDFKIEENESFKLLTENYMTYQKEGPGHFVRYHRPLIQLEKNEIISIFVSPPFEGPLDLDFDKMGVYYDAYIKFWNFAKKSIYKYQFKLEEGDMVGFNNRRILHGRNSFAGPRHLQGTYINMTDFSSKLRHLHQTYGNLPSHEIPKLKKLGNLSHL